MLKCCSLCTSYNTCDFEKVPNSLTMLVGNLRNDHLLKESLIVLNNKFSCCFTFWGGLPNYVIDFLSISSTDQSIDIDFYGFLLIIKTHRLVSSV